MDWCQATKRLSCVLLLTAAAFPAAAITPAPTAKTCDAVMQWARDQRENLPRDYRGMLAYSTGERRAIYSNLSADEKAGYWSDRIGVYLEEHPQLTAVQQSAIAEARSFVKAGLFEAASQPANAVREQEIARFEGRMIAGLGEKATRELFYGFGPAGTEQRSADSTCQCRNLGDCQELGIPSTSCNTAEACDQVGGCGFLNNQNCIGMCNI